MTGLGTAVASLVAAGVVAAGGLAGELADGGATGSRSSGAATGSGSAAGARTALVIDAALARDGRQLVAPRLRALDAELRIARTPAEAETDVRYFAAQGYRVLVAGPDSRAAAEAAGVSAGVLRD